LLSSFRTAKQARASAARILLAVLLLLVLLASVAPFGSLASHRCQMACCIGKSPHAEGSCSVAFLSEENAEGTDEQNEEHSAHHHAQHNQANQSSAKKASSPTTASMTARIITTPCSPECAAAASASTRSPRPRETAALLVAHGARAPNTALFKKDYSGTLQPSAERRQRIRPRAPPPSPVNLSA
jgi:hypothetical protein